MVLKPKGITCHLTFYELKKKRKILKFWCLEWIWRLQSSFCALLQTWKRQPEKRLWCWFRSTTQSVVQDWRSKQDQSVVHSQSVAMSRTFTLQPRSAAKLWIGPLISTKMTDKCHIKRGLYCESSSEVTTDKMCVTVKLCILFCFV